MIRHDGTFYQQMLYHDGTYGSALVVKPFGLSHGKGRLHKLIVKCKTANTTVGSFRINVNGTNVTGSISFKSMSPGEVWEYTFSPSSFSSGVSPEVSATDVIQVQFPSSPSGALYVGLVIT